jgi:hypothetical protein
MDTNTSNEQTSDMDFKLRRRVAKKVLTDIHKQVDEIEQQVQSERNARSYLLPALLMILLVLLFLWTGTDLMRSLSTLF